MAAKKQGYRQTARRPTPQPRYKPSGDPTKLRKKNIIKKQIIDQD